MKAYSRTETYHTIELNEKEKEMLSGLVQNYNNKTESQDIINFKRNLFEILNPPKTS